MIWVHIGSTANVLVQNNQCFEMNHFIIAKVVKKAYSNQV